MFIMFATISKGTIDLLAILQKSLDRALFLYNFIREVRSSGVRIGSITIMHVRNFFKLHHNIVRFRFFPRIAKRSIMEIMSTRSFNAIPATFIRGVFNVYLSNLLCKLYCKYFIYLFFFFYHCKIFLFRGKFLLTYLLTY